MKSGNYSPFICFMHRTYGTPYQFGFIFPGLKSGVTISSGATPLEAAIPLRLQQGGALLKT